MDGGKTWEERFYVSSHPPESHTPVQWGGRFRGHWGIENRNHYRKDATLREDATRVRNPTILANLVLLRNTVLLFFEARAGSERKNLTYLPAWIELNQSSPRRVFRQIMGVPVLK